MNAKPVGKGRFTMWDRVRIKFGASRGCYGTIRYIGGDDGKKKLNDIEGE